MDNANFMDFEPGTNFTVAKPKVQDATTNLDFNLDGILDTNSFWTKDLGAVDGGVPYSKATQSVKQNNGFDFGDMFSGKNIGGTMQGIGAIGGAVASIYDMREQSKFNDDMLDREKKRVKRETNKQDKKQSNYDKVWAT